MTTTQERALRSLYVYHRRIVEERFTGEPSRIGAAPIPTWDGGVDKHGRNFTPVWPKLVKRLAQHGCDPALFVESQFASSRFDGAPVPSMLLSDAAIADCRDYAANGGARAKTQLAAQKTQFLFETQKAQMLFDLDEDAAARQVLADSTLALTALFRYSMAVRGGADAVAELYRASALQQLMLRFHSLVEGWDGFVPDELVVRADELIASLSSGGGA